MNLSKLNPAQASRRRISLSLIGAFGSTLGAAALVLPTPARAFSSGDISTERCTSCRKTLQS